MAESLSLAFVHLLESLSPPERVAFLLREIFEMSYSEIASTLDTSEDNCRQLFARARKHIREQQQRFTVDKNHHRRVLEKFLAACVSGDPAQLMTMLQQDVILYFDGGGKVKAALNPIYGADRVARFFAGITRKGATAGQHPVFASINGELGALIYTGEQLSSVLTLQMDERGNIESIFLVSNPDKLPQTPVM
jgi:RNA polymerase sigma-70 factor (ECF subfamily)